MRINKETGAPTRCRVVKEETGRPAYQRKALSAALENRRRSRFQLSPHHFHPASAPNLQTAAPADQSTLLSHHHRRDVQAIGCVDTGVCNALCTDFPCIVDMNDANSLNGEELGVVENQHARQVKEVDRTWTEALQSTIIYM